MAGRAFKADEGGDRTAFAARRELLAWQGDIAIAGIGERDAPQDTVTQRAGECRRQGQAEQALR